LYSLFKNSSKDVNSVLANTQVQLPEATKTLNDYAGQAVQKVAEKVLEPAAQTFMQGGSEAVAASFADLL
jgi:hypothetical protein